MIIYKKFSRVFFSLFVVSVLIQGVIPTKCLWEFLYDVGLIMTSQPPKPSSALENLHDVWGETDVCNPDDPREQHQKNFGPVPNDLKYAEDPKTKAQIMNRVQISTNIQKPMVGINSQAKVLVKHRTNITLPEYPAPGYASGLSSETTILICFLALVVAIALYLSFCLYQEKKQKKIAVNSHSLQSVVTAASLEAEDSENEVNEILLDDISNLTSAMMVRAYLESLVMELKNSHTKENLKQYITDEFLNVVSERIARDAYMRMNFMQSITAESLLKLAHLYHLSGMHQRRTVANMLGLPQEQNINVRLKVGKGFEIKTQMGDKEEELPKEDGETQTEVKEEAVLEDGETQTDKTSPQTSSVTSCSTSTSGSASESSSSSSSSSSDAKPPVMESTRLLQPASTEERKASKDFPESTIAKL